MERTESKEKPRGQYIVDAVVDISKGGNSHHTVDEIRKGCASLSNYTNHLVFKADLDYLVQEGILHQEGERIYLQETWQYEVYCAQYLAGLRWPQTPKVRCLLPGPIHVNGITLTDEQCDAVDLALSNRMSLIMGGAGTGKTTLIEAIVSESGMLGGWALCAPTGKASMNLTERTGLPACTVYSTLGKTPDDNLLSAVKPEGLGLVIVDEVSMLSLKEFAGLVRYAEDGCRIVLLGDGDQLLSVGSGNVLPDLLALNIPSMTLTECHRQKGARAALVHNVFHFKDCHAVNEMQLDESFQFLDIDHFEFLMDHVAREAAARYRNGESIQVITPRNETVDILNRKMQAILNPVRISVDGVKLQLVLNPGKRNETCFRDGDRVMMLENDRDRVYSNGDIGILRIEDYDDKTPKYSVEFSNGRIAQMYRRGGLYKMRHAYAITVHKSQGSEYAAVILILSRGDSRMLYRNLVYTGISRAKREVKVVGSIQAFDDALKRKLTPRNSALVERVSREKIRHLKKCFVVAKAG